MKVAVRYYSRGGNTKAMAEALARGAGCEALSIEDPKAAITQDVDLLFIGGALYAYSLDKKLVDYIATLPADKIGRAVCFGTSWLTRRPVFLIQGKLKERGITIAQQAAYSHGKPKPSLVEALEFFAKNEVDRDTSLDGMSPYEQMQARKLSVGNITREEAERNVAEKKAAEAAAASEDEGVFESDTDE
ncbi:MAG: hypothetical protein Q4B54_01990 [Coriobacteriales bacterium]|nr:hypothetical protein [Coriobacteriales bacterium]